MDLNLLLEQLRSKLPPVMREQLDLQNQTRAYFLLEMLSDDVCVHQLRDALQERHPAASCSKTPIEQALLLVSQLQKASCNPHAPFKYRLPSFLGEYPIHSREINNAIHQFNQLIETYYTDEGTKELDASELNKAYQSILTSIERHHMGGNIHSLWQLLKAMTGWSTVSLDEVLHTYPYLLSPVVETKQPVPQPFVPLSTKPVEPITPVADSNKQADAQPFVETFDYRINEAGRIGQSNYLLFNGFALKPGGHTDALTKTLPPFLPWDQWQCIIRRQLSQLIELPLNEEFFFWLQTVLQRLGIEFINLQSSSYECYVSPFLKHQTTLSGLNEEMVLRILQEQCEDVEHSIDALYLPIISRYLMRLLQGFQFNRGQALGIGANWGGVVSDSNEAGADAFRFNDPEWATHFRNLSIHRQGPAEAHMNAAIGIKYELGALVSSFEYMTQLQASEHASTVYNALVDNLVTGLFPAPQYYENATYIKHRRQHVITHKEDGTPQIDFFYQPDTQGTYYKTKSGDYKQTPMFRQAGSLEVESFPRDTGSGDNSQSLSVDNPLWPLQLQYAQASSSSIRGHLVYNPIGADEFIPDAFYGQIIRESERVFVPFIGVIPKNFDGHFKQVELCASFVVRMLQSSRLMTYCPTFSAYYYSILTRFLPPMDKNIPTLPNTANLAIKHKWNALDKALHNPERTAALCHDAFFSLFKELIHSLYALTKNDPDLHYYFIELTTSADAFEPRNRATCERLIRELTTIKPLLTSDNVENRQHYEQIVQYLSELTNFFYPHPSDETAKAIAQQAHIHSKSLLALPKIKEYFADLSHQLQANLSPKVSPGLMHDAVKYQGPSPDVSSDFYKKRHGTNFPSGFRDVEGNQIVKPSSRETWLDKMIKTGGALLPLIYRNNTIFSLITQPVSQTYIQGQQAYLNSENYKFLWAFLSGFGGFFYGAGLGVFQVLNTIPKTIYTGLLASKIPQYKANNALAISSAPSNEPGLRIEAIMAIRDQLLKFIAIADGHELASDQLINLIMTYVKKIHPSLLVSQFITEVRYKELLSETFPLEPSAWQQLFAPVIRVNDNAVLQKMVSQYALQIDCVFIYALYECLTMPDCDQATKKTINTVIDKHKLKGEQATALTAFVNYYVAHPEAKKEDIAQYRFHGPVLMKLKEREQQLRKIQMWMTNALDKQWVLEATFKLSIESYRLSLNPGTLSAILALLPDNIKAVLYELLLASKENQQVLKNYHLDKSQETFLLQCAQCYQTMALKKQKIILEQVLSREHSDSSLSAKAREHLKLTQFIQREWHHQLLPMDKVQPIIDDLKKQVASYDYPAIDKLAQLYQEVLANRRSTKAFDAFYNHVMELKQDYLIENSLNAWVNVTMNVWMNALLDTLVWTRDEKITSPLRQSKSIQEWLWHLKSDHPQSVRALLTQQIEETSSFDQAAWRCQFILQTLEEDTPEMITGTGMQKLLRIICQNTDTLTPTREYKAKEVDIAALCKHSITMQRALKRVKEKIPDNDFVRVEEVTLKGLH